MKTIIKNKRNYRTKIGRPTTSNVHEVATDDQVQPTASTSAVRDVDENFSNSDEGNNRNEEKGDGKGWKGETTKGLIISTENGGKGFNKRGSIISTENGGKGFNKRFDNFDRKWWKGIQQKH